MALMKWSDSLSVHVAEIDEQHKELFKRINILVDAMSGGKGSEELGSAIKFLDKYVSYHFGTEEKYMDKFAFPDAAAHKGQHEIFIMALSDIKEDYKEKGYSAVLAMRLKNSVSDWLVKHIGKLDVKLGAFLKGKIQ